MLSSLHRSVFLVLSSLLPLLQTNIIKASDSFDESVGGFFESHCNRCHGIPALLRRFREQTTKGFMWKDIGLSDWYFDSDSNFDMDKLTAAVLELANDAQECIRWAKKPITMLTP